MKDTMQSALQQPDLSVWGRTYLPTTSSRTTRLQNGSLARTYSVWRPSEDGDMESLETKLNELNRALTEWESSQWEECLSSWDDIQKSSSETLCLYSTSVLMEQPERLAHMLEGTSDESTFAVWRRTLLTSVTSLVRMGFGSSLRTIFLVASTIHRTTN